mmetsp:Transcript_18388/g.45580  ORF Transcript_18388/g.45580 Transcript_18388/m.45580 type:complete len:198 (+) Transcript_18388:141-734(+)
MSKANDDKQPAANPQRMSSQMQAVVRLLAGQEERTIAQKLADSNRPTWEQYKKDNHEHLNLDGLDQKKMEDYRQKLDSEREKKLSRGRNHSAKKRRRDNSSDDDTDDNRSRHRHKKEKKKKKRKHKRRHRDDSSYSSDSDDESSEGKRRKHRRKHKKRTKSRKKSSRKKDVDSDESDGSHYRLSKFFDQGESDSERK